MKKLFFLLLGLCAVLTAQPANEYQQGHAAYQSGDFHKAAQHYETVLASGLEAYQLYYNLGNCYYKLNQIGKCLLYYEKAAKLNPSDPDLLYNLELVRLRVVDKLNMPPEFFWQKIWKSLSAAFSLDQLAIGLVVLLFLAALAVIGKFFFQRDPWRMLVSAAWLPLVVLAIVISLFFFLRLNQSGHERTAIIMAEKVSVLSSPSDRGTEVFALHEGSKVRIAERSSGFVRISLPDGKVGWAPLTSLAEI